MRLIKNNAKVGAQVAVALCHTAAGQGAGVGPGPGALLAGPHPASSAASWLSKL